MEFHIMFVVNCILNLFWFFNFVMNYVLLRESKKKKQKKQKTKPSSALSFNVDEEDDNESLEPGEKNEYISHW